jgi:hypothetical protein
VKNEKISSEDSSRGDDFKKSSRGAFFLRGSGGYLDFQNPATKITVGLVAFVFLIVRSTFYGYSSGRKEVEEIVEWKLLPHIEHVQTLRQEVDELKRENEKIRDRFDRHIENQRR